MRRFAALLCAMTATACGDAARNVAEPGPGMKGMLEVRWTSPHANDGAARIAIRGPGLSDITPAHPDQVVFKQARMGAMRVAVFGKLESGRLVAFHVSDTTQFAAYSVELVEVASESGELRTDLSDYTATISTVANP